MGKLIMMPKFIKLNLLTPLMLKTLRHACKKQRNNEEFSQATLPGSFTALLNRGFISIKTVVVDGNKERSWYVTTQGIDALKNLGFKELC